MTQEQESKRSKRKGASALFIPAGLFIGTGIGWAVDHSVQGMFIGLGAGFLIFAIIMVAVKD